MKDVGMKPESYRTAIATGILHAPPHCIELLRNGNTDKGDALKTARIAGILGAKRTDELIPLCHPLPIYRADVEYQLEEAHVVITAVVETIGPTGVEMEALTAANVAALTGTGSDVSQEAETATIQKPVNNGSSIHWLYPLPVPTP